MKLRFILDAATWAWSERAFLRPIVSKYFDLPGEPPKFDGPALKKAIIEYEPMVWKLFNRVVVEGNSLKSAIVKMFLSSLAPHRMTRSEEEDWFNRASGNGEF